VQRTISFISGPTTDSNRRNVEMFTKLWYNKGKKGDDLYEII
jgi:hypothetical protein